MPSKRFESRNVILLTVWPWLVSAVFSIHTTLAWTLYFCLNSLDRVAQLSSPGSERSDRRLLGMQHDEREPDPFTGERWSSATLKILSSMPSRTIGWSYQGCREIELIITFWPSRTVCHCMLTFWQMIPFAQHGWIFAYQWWNTMSLIYSRFAHAKTVTIHKQIWKLIDYHGALRSAILRGASKLQDTGKSRCKKTH